MSRHHFFAECALDREAEQAQSRTEHRSNDPYGLWIYDSFFPEMLVDRWIRRTYPHVVVGVSAIATEATCQLMKAAGATTVISKEVVEQLQNVILESVGQGSKSTGS
jgi:hypothetical protein